MSLQIGDPAPEFALPDQDGRTVRLSAVSYTHLTLPTSDLV